MFIVCVLTTLVQPLAWSRYSQIGPCHHKILIIILCIRSLGLYLDGDIYQKEIR